MTFFVTPEDKCISRLNSIENRVKLYRPQISISEVPSVKRLTGIIKGCISGGKEENLKFLVIEILFINLTFILIPTGFFYALYW